MRRWAIIALALMLLLAATALGEEEPSQESQPCQHHWTLQSETKASCTSSGKKVYVCDYCGAQKSESTGKSGHNWGEWSVEREPSCTSEGSQTRTCKRCGKTETQTTPKKDHQYGEWQVISAPSDFAAGYGERVCTQCGAAQHDTIDPEGTLRRGDRGEAVKTLQNLLNAAGYSCGSPDGDFGGRTESAVKAFQQAIAIEADGVAWPGVVRLLDEEVNGVDVQVPTALSLTVTGPKQKSFEAGETCAFTVTAANVGAEALTEVTVDCFIENQLGEYVDWITVLSIAPDSALAPGESVTAEYAYVVPGPDVTAGQLTCAFSASALRGAETVASNEERLEIASQGDGAGLTLSGHLAPQVDWTAGSTLSVYLMISNDGERAVGDFDRLLIDGEPWPEDADTDFFGMLDLIPNGLKPGEALMFTYNVVVSPEEAESRALSHVFLLGGHDLGGEGMAAVTSNALKLSAGDE